FQAWSQQPRDGAEFLGLLRLLLEGGLVDSRYARLSDQVNLRDRRGVATHVERQRGLGPDLLRRRSGAFEKDTKLHAIARSVGRREQLLGVAAGGAFESRRYGDGDLAQRPTLGRGGSGAAPSTLPGAG